MAKSASPARGRTEGHLIYSLLNCIMCALLSHSGIVNAFRSRSKAETRDYLARRSRHAGRARRRSISPIRLVSPEQGVSGSRSPPER